jgi:hypothetical protein
VSSKREKQQFRYGVAALLRELGATLDDDAYYWRLTTKVGSLRLHICTEQHIGPGTVFTRFDDVDLARTEVLCNPHSGKWNHHYLDNAWTAADALKHFKFRLGLVMS